MATYVCSDIHGRYDRYNKIFDIVKDTDVLYILGDCIDRHDGGPSILKDIMKRKNVKLLRGNHEDMMLKAKTSNKWFKIWSYPNNGGLATYEILMSFNDITRNEIFEFVANCPICVTLNINNKNIYLAHGSSIARMFDTNTIYANDLSEYELESIVWDSPFKNLGLYDTDYDLEILGHVYVQHFQDDYHILKKDKFINMDGGCAFDTSQDDHTRLILLRLEDMKEFYIK